MAKTAGRRQFVRVVTYMELGDRVIEIGGKEYNLRYVESMFYKTYDHYVFHFSDGLTYEISIHGDDDVRMAFHPDVDPFTRVEIRQNITRTPVTRIAFR